MADIPFKHTHGYQQPFAGLRFWQGQTLRLQLSLNEEQKWERFTGDTSNPLGSSSEIQAQCWGAAPAFCHWHLQCAVTWKLLTLSDSYFKNLSIEWFVWPGAHSPLGFEKASSLLQMVLLFKNKSRIHSKKAPECLFFSDILHFHGSYIFFWLNGNSRCCNCKFFPRSKICSCLCSPSLFPGRQSPFPVFKVITASMVSSASSDSLWTEFQGSRNTSEEHLRI